ncbi:hypothetical protein J3R04_001546 [Spirilliplanes yamanashiensis]|nr:hypothetical protein [Spirilliplanes yamanashiensis]
MTDRLFGAAHVRPFVPVPQPAHAVPEVPHRRKVVLA